MFSMIINDPQAIIVIVINENDTLIGDNIGGFYSFLQGRRIVMTRDKTKEREEEDNINVNALYLHRYHSKNMSTHIKH